MSSSKRASDAPAADNATPAKRTKTEGEGAGHGAGAADSSPAVGRDTDSPSNRGGRGGRGGGRGGRGGGDKKEKSGRGRGGYKGGDRRGGRAGDDSRTWGGRSDNAKGGMRVWGKKEGEEGSVTPDKAERLPKKKVAVLVGYNGAAYKGSQINPGIPTLEGVVFQSLAKAGAISPDNADDHQKVSLSRAARTDAGVHAAYNVLSLKMILSPPDKPAEQPLEEYLNTFLPPTIRIWSVVRVQGSFNPKNLCDQRQYEYTLPTHLFLGPKPGSALHDWLLKCRASAKTSPVVASAVPNITTGAPLQESTPAPAEPNATELAAATAIADSEAFWAAQPEGSTFADDVKAKKGWRISKPILDAAQAFVTAYEGSHNYYNFTVGMDFRDRSASRTMRKLEVSEPFVVDDVEYVSVGFLGQSFMLHQIRKMIALAILAVRTSTPPSLVAETFGPSRIHIPKAPALGLILLGPQYGEYNKRVGESNVKLEDLKAAKRLDEASFLEQKRDPLEIGEDLDKKIQEFKKEMLLKKLWEVENTEATFSKWINYVDVFIGTDFEYLNPKGVIPASAVSSKGPSQNGDKGRPAAVEGANEDVALPSDDEETAQGQEEG